MNSQNVDAVFLVGDAVDGERNETYDRLGPLQLIVNLTLSSEICRSLV